MIIVHRYSLVILLCVALMLSGCSEYTTKENTKPIDNIPVSTTAPISNAKTPLSGTAFTNAMEQKGFEWRGDQIYSNGKYSDDEFKFTEIREYAMCVADNNNMYSDVMLVVYYKCANTDGAAKAYNELKSYTPSVYNEQNGDNYAKIELHNIDGWEYGIICLVDNTIVIITAENEYKNNAAQLMLEFGY